MRGSATTRPARRLHGSRHEARRAARHAARRATARGLAAPRPDSLEECARIVFAVTALLATLAALLLLAVLAPAAGATVNTAPPASPVKLVFVHHSTGQAWLADGHGGLGIALRDNNYFVSDTNYGWGPDSIGDRTDIGHWWTWFRGPSADTYLTALYAESGQNCSYSRLGTDPGGANEIVMFKSCFPNSQLSGSAADPVPAIADNPLKDQYCGGAAFTVANAKGIYIDLLAYFGAHPEKLFVVIVAPPVTSPDTPGGRALADWLVDHWLQDAAYAQSNVVVFDYYTVLSSNGGSPAVNDLGATGGNHHRVWNGAVQHVSNDGVNHLAYPSAGGDSHPNATGDLKATAEFVPLLNDAYNAWKGNAGSDTTGPQTYAPRRALVTRGKTATLYYRVADDQSPSCVVKIQIKTLGGRLVKTLRPGLKGCDTLRHAHFACALAKKTYRFYVYARDLSGNKQTRVGSNRLVVR